jgi:signal peptidase I
MAAAEPNHTVPLWRRLVVGRDPVVTLARACVLAATCLLVFGVILRPVQVRGISMLPAYKDRSYNLLYRWAYLFHEPRRGDVVCIRTSGEKTLYLKRVVGLPGERIAIRHGLVFINGEPLAEPYVKARDNWNWPEQVVGPDKLVVIGDNRGMDQRWHAWGDVERVRIAGKVLW